MALTKSDFENYRVNEVMMRRENPKDALSHQKHFINEWERCSESSDATGSELFELMSAISSMYLDPMEPNAPFKPYLSSSSERLPIPDDIPDDHLGFLAEIVREVTETHMRARIADVLWLRKRDHKSARLAHASYLQTVDLNNLTYETHKYAIRALQITKQLNDKVLANEAVRKAKQLAEKYYSDDKWHGVWCKLLEKIAKHSENDREAIVDQISQEALRIEQDLKEWGAIPTIGLWEICADLSKGDQEQKALQKAIDGLVERAEYNANQREFGGATGDIRRALELQKKVVGKGEQFTDLQTRFHRYQKRYIENIPLTNHKFEMGQSFTDIVNAFALEEMERIKGSTLALALEKLARISHSIQLEEPSLFSMNIASNSRIFHFICPIWPAVLQINIEHKEKLVNANELENIFSDCDFIPKKNLRTFTYAMLAGLKSDLVAVAHVLPPQLENAFRQILKSKDVVTVYTNDERIGQERPLSWILQQEEIIEILDENLLRDLENLLVKKHTGLNLRNKVAHGKWTDEAFFLENNSYNPRQSQIMYLWWLALHLCFTIKKDNSGNITYQPT